MLILNEFYNRFCSFHSIRLGKFVHVSPLLSYNQSASSQPIQVLWFLTLQYALQVKRPVLIILPFQHFHSFHNPLQKPAPYSQHELFAMNFHQQLLSQDPLQSVFLSMYIHLTLSAGTPARYLYKLLMSQRFDRNSLYRHLKVKKLSDGFLLFQKFSHIFPVRSAQTPSFLMLPHGYIL